MISRNKLKKTDRYKIHENKTETITERDKCTTFLTLITAFATRFNIIYVVYINILRINNMLFSSFSVNWKWSIHSFIYLFVYLCIYLFQDCYILDQGGMSIFVWKGKTANKAERQAAMTRALVSSYYYHFHFCCNSRYRRRVILPLLI